MHEKIEIQMISPSDLALYAEVPIEFTVHSELRVEPVDQGLGGIRLVEQPVVPPYIKDYDLDEPPTIWPSQFDLTNWAFFLARSAGRLAGAAAMAWNTSGVNMLERRSDLAVLWDIRVHPEQRGQGTGHRLFVAVEDWARGRGCRQLKVETQNINVPACRFYLRQGCSLGAIHQHAYAGTPSAHETMLLWYKTLNG